MKKFLRRVGCILLILFCAVAAYPAVLIAMDLESESQGQIFGDLYVFDSKKILSKYQKGEKDLFEVIPWADINDEVYESLPEYPPSNWKQQDYLDTLNIFHETVFQSPFTGKIRGAMFSVQECNQIAFGPQSAIFFTANVNFPRATYYSYDIDLKDGSITWHGNTYEPIITWPISSLDLSKNKIKVEQALQIAEEQGGSKVRLDNQNQCSIDIDISSDHRAGNWVVSYESTIDQFTSLFAIEIDSNTGKHKIIAQGGAGYYTFNPQQIRKSISEGQKDIFRAETERPENNAPLSPVSWTQEDYYQIAKAFNRIILSEDLEDWKIHSISFELDCDDASFGPQQMYFNFWRFNVLKRDYFVQRVTINPRTGIIEANNEYDYDVSLLRFIRQDRETIDMSWIKVPADESLKIAYEAEGKHLYQALSNSGKKCKMSGSLDNIFGSDDASTLEWNILEWKRDYELLGEQDTQLRSFVNIETGALRFFRFYGNLTP